MGMGGNGGVGGGVGGRGEGREGGEGGGAVDRDFVGGGPFEKPASILKKKENWKRIKGVVGKKGYYYSHKKKKIGKELKVF